MLYCDILWYLVFYQNTSGVRSWMRSMLMVVVRMKLMWKTQALVSACMKCVVYSVTHVLWCLAETLDDPLAHFSLNDERADEMITSKA